MIASLRYPEVRCMSKCQSVSVILWPEGHRCLTHLQYDTDVMWCDSTQLYIMTMNIVKLHDAPCVSSDTMSNVSINVTQVNALSFSNSLQRSLQEMSEPAAFSRVQ